MEAKYDRKHRRVFVTSRDASTPGCEILFRKPRKYAEKHYPAASPAKEYYPIFSGIYGGRIFAIEVIHTPNQLKVR